MFGIVARLYDWKRGKSQHSEWNLVTDAIAEIESLTTQRDALLAACRSLIVYANTIGDWEIDGPGDFQVSLEAAKAAIALCPPPCEKRG